MTDSSCYGLVIDQQTSDLGHPVLAILRQQVSMRQLNSGHCHDTINRYGIYFCMPVRAGVWVKGDYFGY